MKLFVDLESIDIEVGHSKIMTLIKRVFPSFSIELGSFDPSKNNNEYQLQVTSFEYDDDEINMYTMVSISLDKQGDFRSMEIEMSQKTEASEEVFFKLFNELLDVITKSGAINKIA